MSKTKRVIALGFFDGVHVGHGALLSRVAQVAAERGAIPAAFTFDTHPENLITGHVMPLISSPLDRGGLMERIYGIQDIIVAHFDRHMMEMPWENFITDYLVRDQRAEYLVVGHDFHFGYKGEGNPQRLQEKCKELGIGCEVIEKVTQEGITISSTYIRKLLAHGKIARANEFLGHPHVLTDTVIHGKKLGSTLGFPTVNLRFAPGVLVPAHGVYATIVVVNGQRYMAVTNVGVRPTVDDGNQVTVEGFILDFEGDLYDQSVRMEFHAYLREEKCFESLEALHQAVMENAQQTRAYFAEKQGGKGAK